MPQDSHFREFSEAVWSVVRRIPAGKVTTYGEIARSLGRPRNARLVGQVMRATPEELDLPCHRVIGSGGELKAGWLFGHPAVMRSMLEGEGVPFRGEYVVDIKRCFWSPVDDRSSADEMNDLDDVAQGEVRLSEI